jgi:hypothetical protein
VDYVFVTIVVGRSGHNVTLFTRRGDSQSDCILQVITVKEKINAYSLLRSAKEFYFDPVTSARKYLVQLYRSCSTGFAFKFLSVLVTGISMLNIITKYTLYYIALQLQPGKSSCEADPACGFSVWLLAVRVIQCGL